MKSDPRPWIRALRHVLAQGRALCPTVDDETFSGALPISPAGTIGGHLRHVADFVAAFVRAVRDGAVDYDRREREPRLEQDRRAMEAHLAELDDELARLESAPSLPGELRVRLEASLAPGAPELSSSLERELSFLVSHTVHHFALIALQLRARGLDPGPEFGVAASTLAHWSVCARPSG
jgi:uncharacterized damage-inducible protein DinB